MNKFLREHFDRNGLPKKPRSEDEAIAYANHLKGCEAYVCSICWRWHIGHGRPKIKNSPKKMK